jgi:hypothetical protein
MADSQGAELEGVGPSRLRVNGESCGLLRLCKSVEMSKSAPLLRRD